MKQLRWVLAPALCVAALAAPHVAWAQSVEWRTRAGATVSSTEKDGKITLTMKDPAGARIAAGSVLFEGVRNGSELVGQAYSFFDDCRPVGYQVRGRIEDGGRQLVLEGRSPVRVAMDGSTCRPTALEPRTLTFVRQRSPDSSVAEAPPKLPRNLGAAPTDYMTQIAACWTSHSAYAGFTTLTAPEPTHGRLVHRRSGNSVNVACGYRAYWVNNAKPELYINLECRYPGAQFERVHVLPIEDMKFQFVRDETNFSFRTQGEANSDSLTTGGGGALVGTCASGECARTPAGRGSEVRLPIGNVSIGMCASEQLNRISSAIPVVRQARAEQLAREEERRKREREEEVKRQEAERLAQRNKLLNLCAPTPAFKGGPWLSSGVYHHAALQHVRARVRVFDGQISDAIQFTSPAMSASAEGLDGAHFACVDTVEYLGDAPNPFGGRGAKILVTGKALFTHEPRTAVFNVLY